MQEYIEIHGARENNLKNVSVDTPTGIMATLTDVASSGKKLTHRAVYLNGKRYI